VTACQRWRHRQHSWRRTSEGGFNPDHYGVAEIAGDTTPKAFIETHHYSGSYVSALRRYGLYDITGPAPGLAGVAVLSYPANDAVLLKPFPGLAKGDESAELGRLVLLDEVPANAESHFMAEVFRLAADVGYRGIVSFSDPNPRYDDDGKLTMPGHLGIVYQALNARYTNWRHRPPHGPRAAGRHGVQRASRAEDPRPGPGAPVRRRDPDQLRGAANARRGEPAALAAAGPSRRQGAERPRGRQAPVPVRDREPHAAAACPHCDGPQAIPKELVRTTGPILTGLPLTAHVKSR